jgi:hypothetical protein
MMAARLTQRREEKREPFGSAQGKQAPALPKRAAPEEIQGRSGDAKFGWRQLMVMLMVAVAVVEPDVPVMVAACGPPVSVTFNIPLFEAASAVEPP